MSVRDLFREDDDERIAADIRAAPDDLALRIQHHPVGLGVAPGEPGLAGKAFAGRCGIGVALGELLAGDAADKPGVAVEFVVSRSNRPAATRPSGFQRLSSVLPSMLAVMWQITWGFIGSSLLRTLGSLAVLIVADFGSFYCDLSISSIVTFADSVTFSASMPESIFPNLMRPLE
jgi:hypothetical protein